MSWEAIDANSNAEGRPWVAISVHNRKRSDPYLQAKIILSKSIAKHLGTSAGRKVIVMEGHGDHSGWVEIRRAIGAEENSYGFMLSGRHVSKGNVGFRISAKRLNLIRSKTTKITMDDAGLILTTNNGRPVAQIEIPRHMFGGSNGRTEQ